MSNLYRILIDTCIWLDLAKDYRAAPLVRALYEMCDNAELEIIVPDIVTDEFQRNKERVLQEAQRSLMSHLRALKQAIPSHGSKQDQKMAMDALSSIDFASATGGAPNIVEQVEELMHHSENIIIESSIIHRSRAASRALDREAPCHRDKNSIADAILFEIYDELRKERENEFIRYAFATTNFRDFSEPAGDNRLPHPSLKYAFSDQDIYVVDIAKFVEEVNPGIMNIRDLEIGFAPEFRTLSELIDAEHMLFRQIWYNRHWNLRARIDRGEHKVVPEVEYSREPYRPDQTPDTVWEKALEAAKRTEEEVGIENLGPWDAFEWGMINGKLSAIRWVLGDEWDMLDT